jgi:glycosyltransferase involved in cell wall biosynthesis
LPARAASLDVTLATFAAQPGGVWRHMVDLAGALTEAGVTVGLAVPAGADELRRQARDQGFAVRDLDDTTADVWHVHLHDTLDRRAMRALLRRRLGRQATVATEHLPRNNASDPALVPGGGRPGARQAKTVLKRAALAATDRTILVSAASLRFMRERYGVSEARLHVVPNAIRPLPARPAPDGLDGTPVTVIAVGSLIMQKGVDVLIDAAAGADGWRVHVVGSGPHRAELEERARTLGAPVTFTGWSDDVLGEIQAAGIFCLPSRWEACPYVVLEAMAIGRPIVATAVDGVPEQVRDGVTGRLVAPDDPAALRAAIDELVADPGLRARWGAAGAEAVAREHPFDAMVAATLAVYRDAAGTTA